MLVNKTSSYEAISFVDIESIKMASVMEIIPEVFLPGHLRHIIPLLAKLRELTNAIAALLNANNSSATVNKLYKNAALYLRRISQHVLHPNDKQCLELRAQYLESALKNPEYLTKISQLIEHELLILLGPSQATWVYAQTKKEFSYVCAVPRNDLKYFVDNYFNDRQDHLRYLADILGNKNLVIKRTPELIIADLVFAGGSAEHFPKHFVYFLPSDEGEINIAGSKTIIIANLYLHRTINVLKNFSPHVLDSYQQPTCSCSAILKYLLLWMRGHDLGHSICLPATNYKDLSTRGFFISMVLQETVADCFGYLLVLQNIKIAIPDFTEETQIALVLTEMLRYSLKASSGAPDILAASFELNFLLKNAYVKIVNQKLRTSFNQLQNGLIHLTKTIVDSVLSNNQFLIDQFIRDYAKPLPLDALNINNIMLTVGEIYRQN